jgi:hypothetical protein
MEAKAIGAWRPAWDVALDERQATQSAMTLDSLLSTRPVRMHAETPDEINELFDPIAYEKSGGGARHGRSVRRGKPVSGRSERIPAPVPVRQRNGGELLDRDGPRDSPPSGPDYAQLRGAARRSASKRARRVRSGPDGRDALAGAIPWRRCGGRGNRIMGDSRVHWRAGGSGG